jgi:hypothetical protein
VIGSNEIEEAWLKLFEEMRNSPRINPNRLAAPFLSVPPPEYDPVAVPSVLYFGKATGGDWYSENFRLSPTVDDRHNCTINMLEEEVKTGRYHSAFWHFALELSRKIAPEGRHVQPLQNLVWTNICKIGVVMGNPTGRLFAAQRDLARETLKWEIHRYRPSLVFFVTGDYHHDFLLETVADSQGSPWQESREGEAYSWRKRVGRMPAMLRTCHPQFKPRRLLDLWIEKPGSLLSS